MDWKIYLGYGILQIVLMLGSITVVVKIMLSLFGFVQKVRNKI